MEERDVTRRRTAVTEIDPACLMPAWVAEVIPPETLDLYRTVLHGLLERKIPFLVGGAYAMTHHAGIERHTRDLDLFIRRETVPAIERAAAEMGLRAHEFASHWLGKITTDAGYVDLIWSSGNAAAPVDDEWFERSVQSEVFGIPVRLIPAEEMIWSKAYIQERERFDGADVAHILLRRGETLDWEHLLDRFGSHWRVLFAHLITFGFIYPSERDRIPAFVMRELTSRLQDECFPGSADAPGGDDKLCGGTLLSRLQYLIDIRERGCRDARLAPAGAMTQNQIDAWSRLGEQEAAASLPFHQKPAKTKPAKPKLEPR
jgi:predicted nucleotidyltransferase